MDNNKQQNNIQQMTQEELQKTQVLNLQEVEAAVKFEKRFSKKPALIIGIIGIALLLAGSSFQVLNILNSKKEQSKIENRKVTGEIRTEVLTCIKTTLNNPDGTDIVYSINFNLTNNKLTNYMKTYTVTQVVGNDKGKKTISEADKKYKDYMNSTEGYEVSLTTSDNGYILMNQVDFEILELTKVNNKQNENSITKVDYTKFSSKEDIIEKAKKSGFTCN